MKSYSENYKKVIFTENLNKNDQMKRLPLVLAIALFAASCNTATKQAPVSSCDTTQNNLLLPVVWYQASAEMEALYIQGFNIAKMRLAEAVNKDKGKLAVVVDIDETMLNNSPIEAEFIKQNKGFSKEFWNEWTSKASAEATPGSVDFANFAKSKGVEIFYISNRDVSELGVTIANLKKVGFPYADTLHCLFKTNTSDKELRRQEVAKTHNIILLIGDNLGDLAEVFDFRRGNFGKEDVDSLKAMFGSRYIILPNPMYGDWDKALARGKKLTACEKDSARRSVLKGF